MSNPIASDIGKFVDLAVGSHLLTRGELDRVRVTLCRSSADALATVDDLCKSLITQGLLTVWQCEKLRKGQYKGFFFEQQYKILSRLGDDKKSSRYLALDLISKSNVTLRIFPPDKFGHHEFQAEPA